MNKDSLPCAGIIGVLLAGNTVTALATEARFAQLLPASASNRAGAPSVTPVTSVTGTITALNYDADGKTVNGLYIGATNTMLTFEGSVCGGVGSLGQVNDPVTYSGTELSFASGFNLVRVSNYTDGSTTYSQGKAGKPAVPVAYPQTAGQLTALNYDPVDGAINGFFFTPAAGTEVFVDVGHVDSTVAGLLAGAAPVALSVTGVRAPEPACDAATGPGVVLATSLTIGGTAYLVGGPAYPVGGHR